MIKGITWIGCGTRPLINFDEYFDPYPDSFIVIPYSDNIIIQNCTFQNSLYKAVSVTAFSNVTLNHCKFVNNNHHKDHGAAVYVQYNGHFSFAPATAVAINNCNFSYNGGAKSLVYIEYSGVTLELINTTFHDNQGVSIFVQNSDDLHIDGQVIFENNIAEKWCRNLYQPSFYC